MKATAILFLLFIVTSCTDKKPYPYKISDFRPELQAHLSKLALEKSLPVNDTIARNFIEKESSKEELLQLMRSESPLLRVVAYRAIVNRDEKDYFKILLGHLNDTTKVTWWYYEDACGDFMVTDLLIRKAEDRNKLSRSEKNILVDSVLTKHPYLETSNWMISEIDPNEKYYSLIKKRCKTKTDRCGAQYGSCYALSKFKKKEDRQFLKKKFEVLEDPCQYWVFKAIENNPDEAYFSILEKYLNQTIKKKKQQTYDDLDYYCMAVAAYKNAKSLNLLEQLASKATYPDPWYFKDNQGAVFEALHKYRSPIYDSLYNKLRPQMSDYIIHSLKRPDRGERKTW